MIRTLTSREFGHNVSRAKKLAKEGPVFITDRGQPAFVLLDYETYRTHRAAPARTALEALTPPPDLADVLALIDFEPPARQRAHRPAVDFGLMHETETPVANADAANARSGKI